MTIPLVSEHTPIILEELILQTEPERALVYPGSKDYAEINAGLVNARQLMIRLMESYHSVGHKTQVLYDLREDLEDLWSRHDKSLHESGIFTYLCNRLYFDELFEAVPVCSAKRISQQVYIFRNSGR